MFFIAFGQFLLELGTTVGTEADKKLSKKVKGACRKCVTGTGREGPKICQKA